MAKIWVDVDLIYGHIHIQYSILSIIARVSFVSFMSIFDTPVFCVFCLKESQRYN